MSQYKYVLAGALSSISQQRCLEMFACFIVCYVARLVNGSWKLFCNCASCCSCQRGLSPHRQGFLAGSVSVGFVVDRVALGQVFLWVLWVALVGIIQPLYHNHQSLPHEVCNSPDQSAHYHTLGPKLGASSVALGWKRGKNVRFQVLMAASMKFRIVFWDVLLCKIIVDRRFRAVCCLHHQGWVIPETLVDNYFARQYIPEDNSEKRKEVFIAMTDVPMAAWSEA
jgi:hypothetical protein